VNFGAIIKLRSASSRKAVAISSNIAERMMQPSRQTSAISGRGSAQPKSSEAFEIMLKPCA